MSIYEESVFKFWAVVKKLRLEGKADNPALVLSLKNQLAGCPPQRALLQKRLADAVAEFG